MIGNISQIGKDRIKKVINELQENGEKQSTILDLGFKVLKLDTSNIKSWDGNPEELKANLLNTVSNIKDAIPNPLA